ncbi:MAG: hypothetical protein K9M03_00275 [Kiritimatiellales bacterium]|nr:hypothetical protein [Kiritimatiellales bacterium]
MPLYTGLYEMKPPGLFYLNALSLIIADNEIPLTILKVVLVGAIPVSMIAFVLVVFKKVDKHIKRFFLFTSLIVGCTTSIYILERILGLQAEPFGVFFSILYVLIVGWDLKNMSRIRIVLAAIAIALAVGMREQFLFPLLAAGMLISSNLKFFIKSFVIPCAIAIVAGLIFMQTMGYLYFYLNVYLPDAFGSEAGINELGNIFMRGLHGWIVMLDVSYLFIMPLFGVLIGILWVSVSVIKTEISTWRDIIGAWICTCAGILFMHITFVAYLIADKNLEHTIVRYAPFVYVLSITSALIFVISLIWLFIRNRSLLAHTLVTIVATYPIVFSAGAKNFSVYQLTVAIPVYIAVLIIFMHAASDYPKRNPIPLITKIITLIIIIMPFVLIGFDWQKKQDRLEEFNSKFYIDVENAKQFDSMMDRCGFDNYIPWDIFIRTAKHSPIQMNWATHRSFNPGSNSYFRSRTIEHLSNIPVLIMDPRRRGDTELHRLIEENFTLEQPECAQGYEEPEFYSIYFRKI